MPCDSIRLCQIDFVVANKSNLVAALKAEGWSIQSATATGLVAYTPAGQRFAVNYQSGQASVARGDEALVDTARKAYTFTHAKKQSARFGWDFKKTGTNSFVISRRW